MEQEAQDRLAPELEKLSKLLGAIEEAMRAFGQTGWVNKKIQRAKAAKKFKIESVVQTINRRGGRGGLDGHGGRRLRRT